MGGPTIHRAGNAWVAQIFPTIGWFTIMSQPFVMLRIKLCFQLTKVRRLKIVFPTKIVFDSLESEMERGQVTPTYQVEIISLR